MSKSDTPEMRKAKFQRLDDIKAAEELAAWLETFTRADGSNLVYLEKAALIRRLLRQNAELETALRPFALHPAFHASDDWPVTFIDSENREPGVTVGDFRRARAVLPP